MKIGETLYVISRHDWRNWLAKHRRKKKEIWLISYKKATGKPSLSYDAAVEEALCYGWIDSQFKPIDQEKYASRFSPRRKQSPWSESNKARALELLRARKMTRAGLATLPPDIVRAWKRGGGSIAG